MSALPSAFYRDDEAWARYRALGPETMGDGRVVVGALKLLSDGALGSRGAALHHPYCDDPENTGLVLIPPDELYRLTAEAAAGGFQVCVHAIGDRANTLVLDTFERVLGEQPAARELRLRVEHAQILAEPDMRKRLIELGGEPLIQSPDAFGDEIKAETEKWKKVVEFAGLKVE